MAKEVPSYILYYPSIEFKSDDWVKSALLIWDKIFRIVPRDYVPNDSPTVLTAQAYGLIENIILDEDDIRTTGDQFLRFCGDLPFTPAGLEPGDYDLLHPDKIDQRVYPYLEQIAEEFDGWLKLSKELARGYMFYLSKAVAERRNLSRATDNRDCWNISPYFTENANFGENVYDDSAGGYYSALVVRRLVPGNISEIPTLDIIEHAQKEASLKAVFRSDLADFAQHISRVNNKKHAEYVMKDYVKKLEASKAELSLSLAPLNKNDVYSFFTVGVPTSLTAYSAIPGNFYDYHRIGSSLAIAAVAAFADYRRAKADLRNRSGTSFLIDLDRKFSEYATTGKGPLPNFNAPFEEFIND